MSCTFDAAEGFAVVVQGEKLAQEVRVWVLRSVGVCVLQGVSVRVLRSARVCVLQGISVYKLQCIMVRAA